MEPEIAYRVRIGGLKLGGAVLTRSGTSFAQVGGAIFVRPSDRVAPTATRYPAPSQPPL
jgi:hypothetical protein